MNTDQNSKIHCCMDQLVAENIRLKEEYRIISIELASLQVDNFIIKERIRYIDGISKND